MLSTEKISSTYSLVLSSCALISWPDPWSQLTNKKKLNLLVERWDNLLGNQIVEWKWTQCEWWSSLLLPNQRGIVAQFRMANKYSRNCQNLSDISDLRNHSLTTLGHLICIRHSRLPENWKCQTFEWRWNIMNFSMEEEVVVNKWPFHLNNIILNFWNNCFSISFHFKEEEKDLLSIFQL